MKKLVLTTALCLSVANAAFADGKPAPKMSPEQLRNDMIVSSQSAELANASASASGAALMIPLMLVIILATAATSGGGGHHYFYPYY
jgi:hypothetical protein